MAHYFIGLSIPQALQNFYSNWQNTLRPALPYKRWMHPEDLHITLKFLGAMDEETLQAIKKKVSQLSQLKSFIIELGSLGFFGKENQPRVVWVDVRKNNNLLFIQNEIEEALTTLGIEKEKRGYRPHITLAKKWGDASTLSEDTKKTLQKKYSIKQEFTVSDIRLFRIHPGKAPSYEAIAIYPLM